MTRGKAITALGAFTLAVVLVLAGAFIAPRPVGAENIVSSRGITLLTSNGSTARWVTGTAVSTQLYGVADCFATYVSAVSPATATVSIESSADATNWAGNTSFTAQSSAGTVFTRSIAYGAFMRALIVGQNTNAMTYTVKCVVKNAE